jgi:hypothetical protein
LLTRAYRNEQFLRFLVNAGEPGMDRGRIQTSRAPTAPFIGWRNR